jgi:hypothetical protein
MRNKLASVIAVTCLSIGMTLPSQVSKAETVSFATGPSIVTPNIGLTCVVTDVGAVRCWGSSYTGYYTVPSDLGRVTQLAAGTDHICALTLNGSVRCWGFVGSAQTLIPNLNLVPNDLGTVTYLAASGYSTCAVNTSGNVKCWGSGDFNKNIPSNLGSVTQISFGGGSVCALNDSGLVKCWSQTLTNSVDVVPTNLGKVVKIAVGSGACALNESGQLNCWGTSTSHASKVPADLGIVKQLYASGQGMCVVDDADKVTCWGNSQQGTVPVDLGKVTQISIGIGNTCAVSELGGVKCWGDRKTNVPSALDPVLLEPRQFNSIRVPELFGSPTLCSPVVAVTEGWDPGVAFEYQWLRNGNPISGATSSYYVPVGLDYQASLSIQVTGSKGGYMPQTQTSPGQIVGAGTLSQTPAPKIIGSLKVGGRLLVEPLTWDSGVSFQYQWLRNGVNINGSTGSSYVVQAADFNKAITVSVIGSKDCFQPQQRMSSSLAFGAPIPKIVGSTKVGGTVTVSVGLWYTGVQHSYQWLRNGSAISKATSAKYKLTAADKGKKISVKVTGKKLGFQTVSKTSAPLGVK